ncbi:MAG: UDP-N-acetylglucosamine 2-epimerase [Minisyncoccia bacterium]
MGWTAPRGEETEWVETVEDGWNILAGNDENKIIKAVKYFNPAGKQKNNYGKGNSSGKITKILSVS